MPHVKEAEKKHQKNWRTRNQERVREAARIRYAKNIEKERERARVKNKSNPEIGKKARGKYREKNKTRLDAVSAERRRAITLAMQAIKVARGCIDCGYNANPVALDFDHVIGVKRNGVTVSGSLKSAMAEAEKCVVRCANCHRIKTHRERTFNKPVH